MIKNNESPFEYQMTSAKVERITPDLAKEYLKANVVNRPLKKKTVAFYAEEMRKGQWRMNGEAICFTKDGAMANGQHRLNAIIEYGLPVDILVVRGCDNDSFSTFDSGDTRSTADVFALSGIDNYIQLSSIVNRFFKFHFGLQAISGDKRNIGGNLRANKKITKMDTLNEYKQNISLYHDAYKLAASCYRKAHFLKMSEIGGMYAFLVKDKGYTDDIVSSFFKMFFFGDVITNSTISVLREKLIQDNFYAKRMTASYKSAIIIKTWNAYVTNKELKVLSYNPEKEGKLFFV